MRGVNIAKKLYKVFESYGINYDGRQGNLHLKNDLHMDEVFINGLIFELEYVSQKNLEKDFADLELRPAKLIAEFVS
ncbi:acyl carrier protein [Algoriphagus aestuariicola]|uniref:Acyl carrier protein n=1 Tax=Algoriphagus aestuariicola TaxID=1852016 RepID=A0ABS3BM84_9BACT|nr:acyl carrier protein [Algoriphagus aestuariicola]MBN7800041.1 acyl carrier protein [Algoriphagus aestuariicola]